MKTKNLEDWTFEEILEGIGETVDHWSVQRFTRNEPLYPLIRNALRWLIYNYLEAQREEEDEILSQESELQGMSSRGEDEGSGDGTEGS